MNIRIHENGWTVIVEDIDLKEITQDQMNLVGKYLLTNTVVVFKNQKLTVDDEVRICSMLGTVQDFTGTGTNPGFLVGGEGPVARVTGGTDEHGRPGMFGHVTELEWHCNRVSDPDRRPIIWLYGVSGTEGSRTSWINNILTYNDLPQEKKDFFKTLKLNVGNTQQFINYYRGDEYVPQDITNYRPNLVHTNDLGVTGLFFSWNQTHFIEGMDPEEGRKLIIELREFCEQEKYMYHHDWQDGDIVIAEQWLGIHKRWEFEHMDRRLLHRIATDFSNINVEELKAI
jgi:alpha-ketoglutarate-dependent taurine dioxygenase